MTQGQSARDGTALSVAAISDRGAVRRTNEDRALALQGRNGDASTEWALLAVADGVGGAPAGELASTIAIDTIAEASDELSAADPRQLLLRLFHSANQRICDASLRNPERRGMACTLVVAVVRDNKLWLANAGDSRAYLGRAESLLQLTMDHSLVADGSLAPELRRMAAERPAARHVVTRSLGSPTGVTPDIQGPIGLELGDRLLLCSDGLYNILTTEELRDGLEDDVDAAARTLVARANKRGAPDNVTAVVLRVATAEPGLER